MHVKARLVVAASSLVCLHAQFVIQTISGTGASCGYTGGPATTALLNNPHSIAPFGANAWLVADWYNSVVRNLTASTLTLVAGTPLNNTCPTAGSEEGIPATSARFSRPAGLAQDTLGGFLVTDANCGSVRRVGASGLITTLTTGLQSPQGLTGPVSNYFLLAESGNHVILQLTLNGSTSVLAGTPGSAGNTGDNGPATGALLHTPTSAALRDGGGYYIAGACTNSTVGMLAHWLISLMRCPLYRFWQQRHSCCAAERNDRPRCWNLCCRVQHWWWGRDIGYAQHALAGERDEQRIVIIVYKRSLEAGGYRRRWRVLYCRREYEQQLSHSLRDQRRSYC